MQGPPTPLPRAPRGPAAPGGGRLADSNSPGVLSKIAVRAGVSDGFIGNRLLAVYLACANYLLEDGASPNQMDRAMH
jgi:hypothetical protein